MTPRKPKTKRVRNFQREYQQRVRGTKPGSRERQRARGHERSEGHEGPAALLRYIRPGDLVMLGHHVSTYRRDERGRWALIDKVIQPEPVVYKSGRVRVRKSKVFWLRKFDDAKLRAFIAKEEARGAVMSLVPSLDQRRLVGES